MSLWKRYIFRRNNEVYELWDSLFDKRPLHLLYIAGYGFDVRAQKTIQGLTTNLLDSGRNIESAKLILVGFEGYELDQDIIDLTTENTTELKNAFSALGPTEDILIKSFTKDNDSSTTVALREGISQIMNDIPGKTDIILDVSSMPRVIFLTILTSLLATLEVIPKLYICIKSCYFSSYRFIFYGLERFNITAMVGNRTTFTFART